MIIHNSMRKKTKLDVIIRTIVFVAIIVLQEEFNLLAYVVDGASTTTTTTGSSIYKESSVINKNDDIATDNTYFHLNNTSSVDSTQTKEDLSSSIVDIISNNTDLTIISQAINISKLQFTDPPYTIFAPIDNAFNAIINFDRFVSPPWLLHLRDLVRVHITRPDITDFVDGTTITVGNGEIITIFVNNNSNNNNNSSVVLLQSNDSNATIVKANLEGNDGIVHIIDNVLRPKFLQTDLLSYVNTDDTVVTFSNLLTLVPDIQDRLINNNNNNNNNSTSDQEEYYTVLIPNDEAFTNLSNETISFLLDPNNINTLRQILLYHIIPEVLPGTLLQNGSTIETVQGGIIKIRIEDGIAYFNNATGVMYNKLASNGIIHITDTVLIPDDMNEDTITPTLAPQIFVRSDSPSNQNIPTITTTEPTLSENSSLHPSSIPNTPSIPTSITTTQPTFIEHSTPSTSPSESPVMVPSGNITTTVPSQLTTSIPNSKPTLAPLEQGSPTLEPSIIVPTNTPMMIASSIPSSYPSSTTTMNNSIIDVIYNDPYLTNLSSIIIASDLKLDDPPYTLFAPINDAFTEFQMKWRTLDTILTPPWKVHIREVVRLHITKPDIITEDMIDGEILSMGNGANVTVRIQEGTTTTTKASSDDTIILIYGNSNATIIDADILADDGVLHTLDAVLEPQFIAQSLLDVVNGTDNLQAFATLLSLSPTVQDLLTNLDSVATVLAPTDEAIVKLSNETIVYLTDPNNVDILTQVLLYHILPEVLPTSLFVNGSTYETNEGGNVTLTITDDAVYWNNDAELVSYNILANNGILHTIDTILSPFDTTPTPSPTSSITQPPVRSPRKPTSNYKI